MIKILEKEIAELANKQTPVVGSYYVDNNNPLSSDENPGSEKEPFLTVNRAAELAKPGDTVIVKGGVYRERINPVRGGKKARKITYMAAPGEQVFLRGSEEFRPKWQAHKKFSGVFSGKLSSVKFGTDAYNGQLDPAINGDFNPYRLNFKRAKQVRPQADILAELKKQLKELSKQISETSVGADMLFSKAVARKADIEHEIDLLSRKENRKHLTTMGQLFVEGTPFIETETMEELAQIPGTWMVDPDGEEIFANFANYAEHPKDLLVELSVRNTVFSPLRRGLGYIKVQGFIIEHGANHFPSWGKEGWPQVGLLSTRSGHHWTIEDNIVRYAKGIGIDCGSEGDQIHTEYKDNKEEITLSVKDKTNGVGYHLIRNNQISDNGHCGIAGIRHTGTKVIGNTIERNNCDGYTSPWWEFGGIKFHFFFDGLIEGNLIRDNDAHGIWLDNQWAGSRVTRNVILNNMWSGINIELGRGPVLIDNNIIANTRVGDGIYGHDCSDITLAHNLIFGNANCGLWFAYATPRIKPEDGCWDIEILNNIIAANRAGACALPMPWQCAGRNISNGNLFVGAGEYLDEGSHSRLPLFQVTNCTHMARMGEHHPEDFESQTPDAVRGKFAELLKSSKLKKSRWPNLNTWTDNYNISFEVWQQVLGQDQDSLVMKSIREGVGTRHCIFNMNLDATLSKIKCASIKDIQVDFNGRKISKTSVLPGPFSDLEVGQNRKILWPVKV